MTYFAYDVYNTKTGKLVDCGTGFLTPDAARREALKRIEHNKFMTGQDYTYKIIVEE